MKKPLIVICILLVFLLTAVSFALANNGIDRARQVVGGGATDSSASGIGLQGTIGQVMIGPILNGNVTVEQGFWHRAAEPYQVILPLVLR